MTFLREGYIMIACGGTAMTILGLKYSTKDIDLMVPKVNEHTYLIETLKHLGYKSASGWGWSRGDGFVFDLFRGKTIHTTELIEPPLAPENHTLFKEFSQIYLGVLNYYDIIISKLFRGTEVDNEDCLVLVKHKSQEIDLRRLEKRLRKTASYDVSEGKLIKNWEYFVELLLKEGLYRGK